MWTGYRIFLRKFMGDERLCEMQRSCWELCRGNAQQVGRFRSCWECNIKMNLRAVLKDNVGWNFWFRIRVIGVRLVIW